MLIHGVDILYVTEVQVGVDAFNVPVFEEVEELVENVIVSPVKSLANSDIPEANDLTRRKEVLQLGIPKNDDHNWEACKVRYKGKTYKSCGVPLEGMEHMIPLEWHKIVTVERCG